MQRIFSGILLFVTQTVSEVWLVTGGLKVTDAWENA